MTSTKLKKKSKTEDADTNNEDLEAAMDTEGQGQQIPGEIISTMTVARGSESTIHTAMEHLHIDSTVSIIMPLIFFYKIFLHTRKKAYIWRKGLRFTVRSETILFLRDHGTACGNL
jgi:hypothetical protein